MCLHEAVEGLQTVLLGLAEAEAQEAEQGQGSHGAGGGAAWVGGAL